MKTAPPQPTASRRVAALFAACLAAALAPLASCGAPPGPQPITGTWTTSEPATESVTVTTYTFAEDGTWSSVEVTQYNPDAVLANCRLEIDTTGGTYDTSRTDDVQRVGLTGTTTSLEQRTQCNNTLLDTPEMRFTRMRDVAGTYTVDGNTLTIEFESADGRPPETQVYTRVE